VIKRDSKSCWVPWRCDLERTAGEYGGDGVSQSEQFLQRRRGRRIKGCVLRFASEVNFDAAPHGYGNHHDARPGMGGVTSQLGRHFPDPVAGYGTQLLWCVKILSFSEILVLDEFV